MWPPECDDDILEKTILECQNIYKTRDIQREGQQVFLLFYFIQIA